MFDQIVIVKIIEMQNEADRRRWRKNEDAFYRDHCRPFGAGFIQFWHRLRDISATESESRNGPGDCPPVRCSMPVVMRAITPRDNTRGLFRPRS